MRLPVDWVKRVLRLDEKRDVLALLTPESARSHGVVVRVAIAGVTALGFAAAGAIALGSLVTLMAAIGIIYFLATQVLGLKVNVDPTALYQQMQRQAAGAAAYGPN
jgi:hypothetical protein